jgi:glycosyltransferase involved in cell wall biosynthesis
MKDLLVIASYPPKDTIHNDKIVGVASYTKLLLSEISKEHTDDHITVLCEAFESKTQYDEDGISIRRRWRRGNLISILSLFSNALFRKERTILVSFELYMFGGLFTTALSLILLSILRMSGKRVIFILHQAPATLSDFIDNPIQAAMLNAGKYFFYNLVLLASSHIIVFEEQLKENLGQNPKIMVIPHFVPNSDQKNKIEARRVLDLPKENFIVLYFGFLAPYKGVDLLIRQWRKSEDFTLIIAGGINPNHKDNASINAHVRTIKQSSIEKHILVTDFIPEDRISYWFSACDAVILPYRTFLSSSGPLSLAFSYERPVLLSKALADYAKSPDVKEALHKAGITIEDITYDSADTLLEKLVWIRTYREKVALFSSHMKKARSIRHIAKKYEEILFT